VSARPGCAPHRSAALLAATVLSATAACAAAAAQAGAPARPASAPGTHLQVTEVEYRLMLSEAVVRSGPVDLETVDAGMDPHDLRLRRGGGPVLYATQPIAPGGRIDAVVEMAPGIYHLWCSLPGHWQLGMHATLRVVR
jgi:hypothetical protein